MSEVDSIWKIAVEKLGKLLKSTDMKHEIKVNFFQEFLILP